MRRRHGGLGREFAEDARDRKVTPLLLLAHSAPDFTPRTKRSWNANGWWGDQGMTSQCVGYSLAHWLEDGPVTHGGTPPVVPPKTIYDLAQTLDEWPGTNYDGTSVRGGAKALKQLGWISSYWWGRDVDDLIDMVLYGGPVVVGTNWYEDMFTPTFFRGVIKVGGRLAGGHAYVINGVSTKSEEFRIKNSWGRSWGHRGFARISFDDMARLMVEDGEAMLAVEVER